MRQFVRLAARAMAATALLTSFGCESGPPGAGLTNGEPPSSGSEEQAAVRNDMPTPNLTPENPPTAPATAVPGATGSNPGTAGKGAPAADQAGKEHKSSGAAESKP